MNTQFRKLAFAFIITLAACSIGHAEDLEGTYQEAGSGGITTFKKIGKDKFSYTSSEVTGTGFRDKNLKFYAGVFRYNDNPKHVGKEMSKGGDLQNAVGYHLFEPLPGGGFKVTWQWSLTPAKDQTGTYEIHRVKK